MSNVDSGHGSSVQASPPSPISIKSLINENVSNQVSNPNASEAVKREVLI